LSRQKNSLVSTLICIGKLEASLLSLEGVQEAYAILEVAWQVSMSLEATWAICTTSFGNFYDFLQPPKLWQWLIFCICDIMCLLYVIKFSEFFMKIWNYCKCLKLKWKTFISNIINTQMIYNWHSFFLYFILFYFVIKIIESHCSLTTNNHMYNVELV